MEERGLVRRKPVEGDRRRVRIELTPAGGRAIRGAFQKHVRRVVKELSALSAAEQEQLGRLCKRLGTNRDQPTGIDRAAAIPTRR
jgi:MarR family 2-MHQ and catechol resistance regulon transcriptional repressor